MKEKDILIITIEPPKTKEKVTYTPKFQMGELVYKCEVNNLTDNDTNGWYFNFIGKKIAITKINNITITKDEILYGVDGFSGLFSEKSFFKTKEEMLNAIVNQIKNSVDKLDDLD